VGKRGCSDGRSCSWRTCKGCRWKFGTVACQEFRKTYGLKVEIRERYKVHLLILDSHTRMIPEKTVCGRLRDGVQHWSFSPVPVTCKSCIKGANARRK